MSRILVIGESCLDEFVYCSAERLAPDLPIPILKIQEIRTNPGMAMNVLRNIKNYVEESEILTNSNWKKVKKTRYVHASTNHSFIRIDTPDEIPPYEISEIANDFELIVISDYNKGYLSEETIRRITETHSNVFLDTKKILGDWASNAKFIKINDFEFQRSLPFMTGNLKDKVIHTRGSKGCDFQGKNFGVHPVEIKDSSGAGDSFLAALVVKYLDTQDIEESIEYANLLASKVVSERGVTVI